MRKIVLGVAAVAMLGVAGQAQAVTNILTNGSFESGLTGWTVGGTQLPGSGQAPIAVITYGSTAAFPTSAYGEAVPVDNFVGNPSPDAAGSYAAYFSSDRAAPQTLSQTVTLLANTSYTFGFDYYLPANGYANPNAATFSATLDGAPLTSFTASSQPATTWLGYSGAGSFTTTSTGLFTFGFTSTGDPAKDFAVDRVYLIASSDVPEPTSWAMMVGGFGLLGAAMRRRKVNTTFA